MPTLSQLFMDEIHANDETAADIIGWAYIKDGNVQVANWIDALNHKVDEDNRYSWIPDVAMWSVDTIYVSNNFEDGGFEILVIPNFISASKFGYWTISKLPGYLKDIGNAK